MLTITGWGFNWGLGFACKHDSYEGGVGILGVSQLLIRPIILCGNQEAFRVVY